mgnify:CR=1 FL=1|jgi:hypothetical protein
MVSVSDAIQIAIQAVATVIALLTLVCAIIVLSQHK